MKLRSTVIATALLSVASAEVYSSTTNTVLNQLVRRYQTLLTDHYVSIDSTETAGTLEGALFYIPSSSAAGRTAIYRHYNSSITNHLLSNSSSVAGYTSEGVHGYAYSTNQSYLEPIKRWYNSTHTDHLTAFVGENPAPFGYSLDGTLGYGFPRHGQNCEQNYTVSAGGVTLKANKNAGGAISELTWNGKQFVNNYDYGRQIQSAFNLSNVAEYDNPTEAGSKYGCPGVVDASYAQGSPIDYVTHSGSTLMTRTFPLQWKPENWGGGIDNPVMWGGTIEKDVTLNFLTTYDAHVIKYVSTIDVPSSDASTTGDWEAVTAYLTGDFNKLYAFDAVNNVRVDKTSTVSNNSCLDAPNQDLRPDAGGVINATSNGNYALGVYRKKSGGFNHFALCKFLNGGGNGKYDENTTKWSVLGLREVAGVPAGESTETVYLIVGTLADVEATMRDMYLDGY